MHDVAAIRRAHPIAETVAAAGVALARSGRRYVARCPFHRDRTPSLTVYPDTASWYCFGCGAGGDVIDFVGRLRGTDFRATAAALAGGVAPRTVAPPPPPRPAPRALRAEERAVVETAAAHYARTLTAFADVRAYLAGRGLSLDTARRLRLGYAAGGLVARLREAGCDLELAAGLGLLRDGRERFAGRVVIPDLDRHGRATWLTGRALRTQRLRYLSLALPAPLLGLAGARAHGGHAVVVVEGPFDWLLACEWGVPAVALLGTHASAAAVGALAAFARVYLALDADRAGRRATEALAAQLGPRATPVTLPPGAGDPADLGGTPGGREAFLGALARARTRREARWHPNHQPRARAA